MFVVVVFFNNFAGINLKLNQIFNCYEFEDSLIVDEFP